MSERLLTKVVPKGASLSLVSSGGVIDISGFDVAAALGYGNLSKSAYYLGLAKYCDDIDAAIKLFKHFVKLVQRHITQNHWQDKKHRANYLAKLMMLEGVYGLRCKKCNGLGSGTQCKAGRLIKKECNKCHGTGKGFLTQRERAQITNIPPTSWERNWRSRIELLLAEVYQLDRQLLNHIKAQFRQNL